MAQLDVVFPEHRERLGDATTARARGLLTAFPTARHLAHATPATLRRTAAAGARGFTLQDATALRDGARQSTYSGKAADARGPVGRTLLTQFERLTASIDDLDQTLQALLPPATPEGGPSDATLLQTLPGVGPYTAGTLLGELGSLTRFTDARALVAYVGFFPVIKESGEHAATPFLSPAGSRIARHVLYLAAVNAVGEARNDAGSTSANSPKGRSPSKRSLPSRSNGSTRPTRCSSIGCPMIPRDSAPRSPPCPLDSHWMISSARSSMICGMVRPSAVAILRLIKNSSFVGCSTGKLPGLAPFSILSTKTGPRRHIATWSAP